MINAWIHCCRFAAPLLALACCGNALAHKASDAYLQLDGHAAGIELRVDVALRDLDVALDLDTDGDGKLTWREVSAAGQAIEAYVRSHVQVAGCDLQPVKSALERRVDGVYAALSLSSKCALRSPPVIRYTLLGDVDPTHRGIARIDEAGQATVLKVLDPTRPERIGPGAEPSTVGASATEFLAEGIRHILTGYDHVLFLLCLLLPSVMRRTPAGWRPVENLPQALLPVLGVVTAFTLAHSITLAVAAMKWVTLSPAFIEPAIAVTIVLAALDNLRPIFGGRRAIVTFAFGLVHGFGFAGVLSELDLPTSRFVWALLQFNVGLELGQLAIVAAVTAGLFVLRRRPSYPAWAIRGGSFAAILVGLLWFIERTTNSSFLLL